MASPMMKKRRVQLPAQLPAPQLPAALFPDGDALGVILSFLPALEVLKNGLYLVNKEFHRVLTELSHAWGPDMHLRTRHDLIGLSAFAWGRVKSLVCTSTCPSFSNMVNLLQADLSFGRVVNLAHFGSRALSCLRVLDLTRCANMDDTQLAHLMPHCRALEHLTLTGCDVTDFGLASVVGMPLKRLELNACAEVTDVGLEMLSSLAGTLEYLDLTDCVKVTCARGTRGVSHLTKLEWLGLGGTNVADDGMQSIAPLTNLWFLDLGDCSEVTDLMPLSGLTALQVLFLYNTSVQDDGLEVVRNMSDLREVNLSGCPDVSDAALLHFSNLNDLEHLSMSQCNVTDAGLLSICCLECLEILDLSGTNVSDAGLGSLVGLLSLERLILDGCTKVTQTGIDTLAEYFIKYCTPSVPLSIN